MSQTKGARAREASLQPAPAASVDSVQPGACGKLRLTPLTSIRFFAAVHLLLFHALDFVVYESGGPGALQEIPGWVFRFIFHGYYATSLFFLISGFILTYLYVNVDGRQAISSRMFWSARLIRIYPIHVLVLALFAPVVILRSSPYLGHATCFGMPISLGAYLAIGGVLCLTLIQAWFPEYAMSWNYPTWALSAVVFFYVMFPLLVKLLGWLGSKSRWALLVATPVLGLAPSIIYLSVARGAEQPHFREERIERTADGAEKAHGPAPSTEARSSGAEQTGKGWSAPDERSFWGEVVRRNPLLWLPHFFMGMLLARVFNITRFSESWAPDPGRWRPSWGDGAAVLLVLTAFIVDDEAIAQFYGVPPYLILRHGLLAPLYLVLVYDLANNHGITARLLSLPGLKRLGDASFSIFVFQLPVLALTGVLFKNVSMHVVARLTLKITATIAVALLSVTLFEKPVNRLLKRKLLGLP